MQLLTLDYLKSLYVCWSPEQLTDAAAQWPSAAPTWSWFLGEHLAAMTHEQRMLRVLVAFAHMSRQGLYTTTRRGVALHWFRTCTNDGAFAAAAVALGAWLDAPDPSTLAPLEALLTTA